MAVRPGDDGALLISGGARDPNLHALAAAARTAGVMVHAVLHDAESEPALSWDLETGEMTVAGRPLVCAAAFQRYDVFSVPQAAGAIDRAQAWFSALGGWCQSHDTIRQFNRTMSAACGHKSLILTAARAYGLAIPKTRVTNERETLSTAMAEGPAIVKPVAGGAYTLDATAADAQTDWHDGRAPVPAFVQEKLRYPELRVFFVGSAPHVFEIVSDDLDYRAGRNHSIVYRGASALDGLLAKKLAALAADLGLDFCAFDLKTADDGDLRFMEVNSGPMFAAFDEVARGALCAAMIDWLMARK